MPASPTTRKKRPRPVTASSRPARNSTSSSCRPTKTASVRWWGGGIAGIIPLSRTPGKDGMPRPLRDPGSKAVVRRAGGSQNRAGVPVAPATPAALPPHEFDETALVRLAARRPRPESSIHTRPALRREREKRAVTDSWGRVHGMRGITVADASLLPTCVGVNLRSLAAGWSAPDEDLGEEHLARR